MAQKTEKEETKFKVAETLTLCTNNCGLIGNPATNNMCQKCFNASTTTTATSASNNAAATSVSSGAGTVSTSPRSSTSCVIIQDLQSPAVEKAETASDHGKEGDASAFKREVNRCLGCRKKVGLTGFRCRCGELFCWEHRYSDRHDCSYDYKTAGREAIARENPVVKAAKIVRV